MSESFAQLFEESLKGLETRQGSIVSGTVVAIQKGFVLVDAGLKSESAIPVAEFQNAQGELEVKVGDTVRVHQRIKEGNRERIQVFEGIIIKKQGGSVNATFTVRRIAYGVGVEKTFLVHSPLVEKVEVVRVGKARRAKLYYLRDRVGKAAKTKENIGAKICLLYTSPSPRDTR